MDLACLPGSSPLASDRVLYVDGADGGGAQVYFESAFELLGLEESVDRFDLRDYHDGLDSRVADPMQQLVPVYDAIVWGTAYRSSQSVPDGVSGKSDDFAVLKTYLDNRLGPGGVYLSGQHVADWWASSNAPSAAALRAGYLDFTVANTDHVDAGLGASPLVIGTSGGCFDHPAGPDTTVAFGGCGVFAHFDVLTPQGAAVAEAVYTPGGPAAIVSQRTTNPQATDVGVILSGFGLESMRDDRPAALPDRAEHLGDILWWLAGLAQTPSVVVPPLTRNALAQNYPNPFNPTTNIRFQVRERGRVTIRVYNVAGQLVRTIVDEVRAPGIQHVAEWDGRDGRGQTVASGVYFYRMLTKGFSGTRKMVLLK
jgi:hypothetical protein